LSIEKIPSWFGALSEPEPEPTSILLPEDRGSSRQLDIKIVLSKRALSVVGNHLEAFDSNPASSSFGPEKLVSDLPKNLVVIQNILTATGRLEKPGSRELLSISFLVIAIAYREFWQAFSQQVNNY